MLTIDVDGFSGEPPEGLGLSFEIDYAGRVDSQPVFVGWAPPGQPTSAATWKLMQMSYDGSSRIIRRQWAAGTSKFQHVWDDRAILAYS